MPQDMARLTLDDLDCSVVDPHERDTRYIYDEIFERRIYDASGFRLDPHPTIFDVGANIGLYSIWAARRYRPARILAFEASPVTYRYLVDNTSRLIPRGPTEVRCIDRAVSRASDVELVLNQAPLVSGISTILGDDDVPWVRELRRSGELVCHKVSTTTVSAELKKHAIARVDILKIDVEGHLMEVLGGIAPSDFPRIRNIVLEHEYLGALGLTESSIHGYLRARGYETDEGESTIIARNKA